jgi:peptide chain release factor 1
MDPFLKKLDELENRCDLLESRLSDPAVVSDPGRLASLGREQGRLRPLVSKYRRYKSLCADLEDAGQIARDPDVEEDFRSLAAEEVRRLEGQIEKVLGQLKELVLSDQGGGSGSVIVEIRAGTGGDEAALFAADLYNMYVKYAESRGWKVEQLDFSSTEIGGFREVIFGVKGPGAWSQLAHESGGHRVQRVPRTESQGRIHTSAATVAVLPEPRQVDVEIEPSDVVEHVSRAGGPGGQNVNKVSSAIRLEHVPTGITVSMRDEKSQHKNRAKAWRILRSRIYEHFQSRQRAERDRKRRTMIGTGDRSGKIRTYNFPQNRVTDHRIGLSLYNLDKIMAGQMDELVAALKDHETQRNLERL